MTFLEIKKKITSSKRKKLISWTPAKFKIYVLKKTPKENEKREKIFANHIQKTKELLQCKKMTQF